MKFRRITFLLPLFFAVSAFAQLQTTSDTARMDTIFFLNGEINAVKVVDTVYHQIRFLPEIRTKKPHVKEVEKDRVFSVKFSNGKDRIFYFYDSAIGNVFTVMEAKMFMLGEQEADRSYRNKWPFIIGFAVGVLSPIALPNAVLLSPIAPALTPLHTLIPVIKIDTAKIKNRNYLQYDTYLMGYEKIARKKNFSRSVVGAGIGLAVGFGTWAVPDKTWNSISGYDPNAAPLKQNDPFSKKAERFSKKNFIYGIWIAEVGTAILISAWKHKKQKK